jgi:hypothetical protein
VWRYFSTAFRNRWNLLALFGASGFALLSGQPDVFLPLIMAGELLYIGALGAHPKFQKYVDAQAAKTQREQGSVETDASLNRILRTLPDRQLQRFSALRARCLELRQIALEIKRGNADSLATSVDQAQLQGLDRLLWIYLRLLYTQFSLERFLERTNGREIEDDIKHVEAQLQRIGSQPTTDQSLKAKATLEDNLQTCRDRLDNYQKARGNYELLELEIDRLENKIRTLSELAVNRHEPDFISGQVDEVASSMKAAEKTMSDLQFATGLEAGPEVVPELLNRRATVKATG